MIQIYTAGGTIEGYDYDNKNSKTAMTITIEEILSNAGFDKGYQIAKLINKDSRLINAADRNLIEKSILNSQSKKVLITHGTFTMVETARHLGKLNLNKTIILTGAFIPGTQKNSDATSNLHFAINAFEYTPKGVYIAMHETMFQWNDVKKNIELNRFELLNEND